MSEIELKIPLSESEFLSIYKLASGLEKSEKIDFFSCKKILKSDEYFSRYKTRVERKKNGEFEVIRLRSVRNLENLESEKSGGNLKSYFTTKRKSLMNGFEVNDEKETFVENPDVLRSFLIESGYEIWFFKEKESVSALCALRNGGTKYHLELEKVNGLLYVEIENVSCNKKFGEENQDKVFSDLKEIVALLSLDINKNDARSWVEILKN